MAPYREPAHDAVLDRVRRLSWEGFSYLAGPPEFAFLPKAVLYPQLKRSMTEMDEEGAKHPPTLINPNICWILFINFFLAGYSCDNC